MGASNQGIATTDATTFAGVTSTGSVDITDTTSVGDSNVFTSSSGALNVNGNIVLYNNTDNHIAFYGDSNVSPPSFTNRSQGTKIILYPDITSSKVDYAFGIETNASWYSVPNASTSHKFYHGTTNTVSINGTNVDIKHTTASTSTTTGALKIAGGIGISNTTDAVSISNGGTFTTAGGVGIAKKLYVGTELHVNSVEMTPNTEDIIQEVSFSGANNQGSPANVTGLAFSNGTTRSFSVQMSVVVDATASLYSQYKLDGVQHASGWYIFSNVIGDNALLTFTITSAGQIQYTSANYAGFVSLTMKFRAQTITI